MLTKREARATCTKAEIHDLFREVGRSDSSLRIVGPHTWINGIRSWGYLDSEGYRYHLDTAFTPDPQRTSADSPVYISRYIPHCSTIQGDPNNAKLIWNHAVDNRRMLLYPCGKLDLILIAKNHRCTVDSQCS